MDSYPESLFSISGKEAISRTADNGSLAVWRGNDLPSHEASTAEIARVLVFIDARLAARVDLMQYIDPSWQVVVLDPDEDGLTQIQQAVSGYTGLKALHVLTHGAQGQLQLGSTWLTEESLSDRSQTLTLISQSLAPGADLLLYGCHVAQGQVGASFVQMLAKMTNSDVAASQDATGAAEAGGNWTLEVFSGAVEALPMAALSFMGLLGLIVGTSLADSLVGTAADDTIRGLGKVCITPEQLRLRGPDRGVTS
jgi:hypothetical protein